MSPPGAKVGRVEAPLALYRRYRPDTFTDVIGQAHVTGPLSAALDNNRVHHAYLFSGPRGCGKTTSARILARALNCDKGPTSTPCGSCESCVELARGGPGSIDVIEIDAASHGGVDDARELRERAFFAPMRSRFKVYIIDEAHMVTPQGFNALLKLVEEPPAHLRFVFATTEPDKVIGTIRSRTHHYPFRLVPPKVLGDYLLDICTQERVEVQPAVVPLVVRAGAGSVRDSLSILDQLIGGSGPEGVTYALATALLGYTPDALVDETIDALAADDGATLFAVVDKVIDAGQDPRRFAEDLLQRLRDLVIVSAVPHATSQGLLEVSADQAERLTGQAARFGRAELTRAADIVSQGLTDMRGATAPRLLLELMCARILLPGADASVEGLGARMARLERRLSVVGDSPPQAAVEVPGPRSPTREQVIPSGQPPAGTGPAVVTPAGDARGSASGRRDAASPAALSLVDVRQLWPGVLDRVKSMRRYTWILLSQNAFVKDVGDRVLTIGLVNAGARDSFVRSGADEILRQAMIDELGVDWRVEAIIDTQARSAAGQQQAPAADLSPDPPAAASSDLPPEAGPSTDGGQPTATVTGAAEAAELSPPDLPGTANSGRSEAAKAAIRTTRSAGSPPNQPPDDAHEVSSDDELLDDATLTSQELLSRELGAKVIDDIRHDVT
jgi:DNA polymerase III subunit gamma/tau